MVDPVGLYIPREIYEAAFTVMVREFKTGLASYFENPDVLSDVMAFNATHADQVMPWFGQDLLAETQAQELSVEYRQALASGQGEMRRQLEDLFNKFQLDAIIAPTNGPAWPIDVVLGDRGGLSSAAPAAISGRPAVTIPAGQIHGLPIGITLTGKMWGEQQLLQIAHALEAQLPAAPRPQFIRSLEN